VRPRVDGHGVRRVREVRLAQLAQRPSLLREHRDVAALGRDLEAPQARVEREHVGPVAVRASSVRAWRALVAERYTRPPAAMTP
jgi:hypothetical protein